MKYHAVMVRVGTKYTADYVHILSDMLARNLSELEVTPWCVTDDPQSLPEDVQPIAADPRYPGWWQKVRLFSGDMPWGEGDRILYVDLDTVITGRLEELIQTKGIIKDWSYDSFNSSVMVWDHGEYRSVYERLDPNDIPPNMGDQDWITQQAPSFPILPAEWCLSYRGSAREAPPEDAKVVCFHGDPKPRDIPYGWVPDFWKIGGFHQLARNGEVNVEQETLKANIRSAIARDLPWFSGGDPRKQAAVIVCGGPSLKRSIDAIRDRQRNGARIVTVNNTLKYLLDHGIKPDSHVMLDARPENVAFVQDAPASVRYLIASQCDPSIFDALADRDVICWHNISHGLQDEFAPYAEAWVSGQSDKPMLLVPGGGTVGLRAISLAWMSGYRKIHVYGMDGSYEGDDHHAYPQALNDGVIPVEVQLGHDGPRYRCARWMVRQAQEAKEAMIKLANAGVKLTFHGSGLIPDMSKAIRNQINEQRAA